MKETERSPERSSGARNYYVENDRVPIPGDVPELGVSRGDRGLLTTLGFRRDNDVVALVKIPYSTGQTRGYVEMNLLPEEEILSCNLGEISVTDARLR